LSQIVPNSFVTFAGAVKASAGATREASRYRVTMTVVVASAAIAALG
jgi:hypothetical protein